MTRQKASPMERLIKSHRTRHTNLTAKRAELVAEFESAIEDIDTTLKDINEILSRLEKK